MILPLLDSITFKPRKPATKDLMVGLYNLGCICYINAMLQMLNSVQPFRNGLIMAEPAADSAIVFELQRLFSYLFFSERQDFVPD
jgi:ubiquitin C-terminal hydrolase